MYYVSPFNFFQIPEGQVPDERLIAIEKKKYLARLELSGKTVIQVEGKEYSKDDLIKLFQQLSQVTHWEFHVAIHKNKIFEKFLSDGEWQNQPWTYDPLFEQEEFKEFVRPYLVNAYVAFFNRIWEKNDYHFFGNFQNQNIPLSRQGYLEALFKIQNIIHVAAQEVKSLHEDAIYLKQQLQWGIQKYYHLDRTCLLNSLPDSCQEARSYYFFQLCQLFCSLHDQMKAFDECGRLINSIDIAKCDEITSGEINRLLQFYRNNIVSRVEGHKSEMFSIVKIIFFVILIGGNLLRICSGTNSRSFNDSSIRIDPYKRNVEDIFSYDFEKGVKYKSYKQALKFAGKRDSIYLPEVLQKIFAHYKTIGDDVNCKGMPMDSARVIKTFQKILGKHYRKTSGEPDNLKARLHNGSSSDCLAFMVYPDSTVEVSFLQSGYAHLVKIKDSLADMYFYPGVNLCSTNPRAESAGLPSSLPYFAVTADMGDYISNPFHLDFRKQQLKEFTPFGTTQFQTITVSNQDFLIELKQETPDQLTYQTKLFKIECTVFGDKEVLSNPSDLKIK